MSARIFINYRRDDSAPYAVSIAQYLENAFGKDSVFIDVDRVRPGQSFPDVLNERLRDCKVMLVLIGPAWLKSSDDAYGRRLDNPDDWVRAEIEAALALGLVVIPILVGGATFPTLAALPHELRALADRHYTVLTTNGFRYEMAGLVKDIAPLVGPGKLRFSRWSISNWSIMTISFRLSIVVGILVSAWSLIQMHSQYDEWNGRWLRNHVVLLCAKHYPEETLRQHVNQFGLFDLSKVHCADKTFWATMAEINGATFDTKSPVIYGDYVKPSIAINSGIAATVGVIALGLLLVFTRWLFLWVLGIKRTG